RLAREEKALWAKTETPEDLARQEKVLSEKIRRIARAPEARKRMEPGTEFVIVSGLPRSGMSLMMQMLAAGGLAVMTDGIRRADDFHSGENFEWPRILKLPEDPYVIEEAYGRVVKVPSMLLPHLPREHRYKVIFMDRPIEEVAASQERMLKNNPAATDARTAGQMRPALEQHRRHILKLLKDDGRFDVLILSYPKLVMEPGNLVERIRDFLGADLVLSAMASAIRPEWYRIRRGRTAK
ncbi:MAG: sulfotransferase domain-containing protein, partial [Verrucomicrobia bacterium]|nr:sulfotransferase domain-containing protein [Verrucomicrobiota bacterium]